MGCEYCGKRVGEKSRVYLYDDDLQVIGVAHRGCAEANGDEEIIVPDKKASVGKLLRR